MKRLSIILLLILAYCLLNAVPNNIYSLKTDKLIEAKNTSKLREAVRSLSLDGYEVYYYNDQQVIYGSDRRAITGAKLLCDSKHGRLYLVSKLPGDNDLSMAGDLLLDMGSTMLLRSNMGEVELRNIITNPFAPMDLTPMQLNQGEAVQKSLSETRTSIENLISHVSADSVLCFIQTLQNFQTRYAYADNRMEVATWIKNQFLRFGISNASLFNFQWQNTTQYDVVATITGSVYPDTYIVVGGHHDSITNTTPLTFAPGADDNASGTVAAIEMARVMMATGFQPKCSIRFVTFAAEEFGLWGSKAYAQYAENENMDIRLMINHDMIANTNPNPADLRVLLMPYDGFIQYTDNAATIMNQYTSLVPVYGSMNLSASDSYSFWQRGFPVIYYFEYNFSQVYHSNNDIVANINPAYCAEVIKASTATAASYAIMPSAPSNLRVLDAGTGNSLGVYWDAIADPFISQYKVYWGTETGVYPFSQTTTANQFTITGLSTGQTYNIAVSSLDSDGNESYRIMALGTPWLVPLTPHNFTDAPVHSTINLSWTPNTELDLASYKLYRSMDPVQQGTLLATLQPSDASYSDANLLGSSAYYCYRLCAVDNAGNQSPFTEVVKSRPVSLDQGILVIDESKNFNGTNPFQPTDEQVDSFYAAILTDFNTPAQMDLEQTPELIRLADIGIYSSILWHGNEYSETSYPYYIREALRQYIFQGGNIFFSLYHPSQAFELNAGYPVTFPPTSFIREVLGISQADYSLAARFKYAYPTMTSMPFLQVDSLKTTTAFNGHIFHVEAIIPEIESQTMYAYGSSYETGSSQGALNNQPVGVINQYGQGRVITLSFPLYNMLQAPARALISQVFGNLFNESSPADDPALTPVSGFRLYPSYPNPFTRETFIPIESKDSSSPLKVEVYNLKGQIVRVLYNSLPAAKTQLSWDGKDAFGKAVSTGIYFIKVQQGTKVQSRKVLLLK